MTGTATRYEKFATQEARGSSAAYEKLALDVAANPQIIALLDTLPPAKRQPNLLFAVLRLLGAPTGDLGYVTAHWDTVAAQIMRRATQTNEAGRSAALMPALTMLPQPLALIDVGASAGLNLYPDKYAYRYGNRVLGNGTPVLDCDATNFTVPDRLPTVTWRAGIDLNPLDITDPDDFAWLDALIWPEHTHRRRRLHEAAAVARTDHHTWSAATSPTNYPPSPPKHPPEPHSSSPTPP